MNNNIIDISYLATTAKKYNMSLRDIQNEIDGYNQRTQLISVEVHKTVRHFLNEENVSPHYTLLDYHAAIIEIEGHMFKHADEEVQKEYFDLLKEMRNKNGSSN